LVEDQGCVLSACRVWQEQDRKTACTEEQTSKYFSHCEETASGSEMDCVFYCRTGFTDLWRPAFRFKSLFSWLISLTAFIKTHATFIRLRKFIFENYHPLELEGVQYCIPTWLCRHRSESQIHSFQHNAWWENYPFSLSSALSSAK
jgi:hypothetical protein